MRRWTALALLLCCPLSATAQNYNPASSCALISAGFIEEFGDDTQYSQGPLLDQGFTDILLLKDYQPAYDPVVSVGNIVSAIEDGVGVWHNSSHGVTHWMAMETRPADSLGYQYTVAAMADYRGPGGLFEYQAAEIAYYLDPWSGYYYFEVSGSALGSFAVDVGTYFHNASCCSFSYVHELPFQSVASYTAEVLNSDAISDLEWIFQGLNGERGFDNRSLGEAANGSSHLFTLSFEQDYSLTPAVKEFSPPDGVQLPGAGPFPGYVEFDSRLSALGDPAEILLGLGGVRVQGCVWSAPNRIDFEILPYVSGQATLGVYPTRATAELCPQLHLDGNQNPSGSNGRGPAGDWFKWQLQVDHADPNLAVVFEGAWAFPSESGGTRVAWISDTERDALRFEVYGGSERRQLLTTLPAAGAADRPHYYETEVGGRWDHVEVVEVDRGQQRLCASRPFAPRAGPPAEIEALRSLNRRVASWPPRFGRRLVSAAPARGDGLANRDAVLTDLLFYSSRQDFLSAVQPVRDLLTERYGLTSQTVLGGSDPAECRAAMAALHQLALDSGYERLPMLIIVGEANSGYEPEKNIVGTYYWPDSTGTCFWDECASDARIVDFDDDKLPDLPWTRVLGYTLTEIEHAAASALEFYEGIHVSSPHCLLLDGDLGAACLPLEEPRGTLTEIAAWYEAAGIPITTLHDSEFASCSDWQARHDAGVAAVTAGITEMIGIGHTTNRSILPGYIFQKIFPPVFDAAVLDTPQRIVVEFPSCGLGDNDRANPNYYPSIMKMLLSADPAGRCSAVAWLAQMRGGYRVEHLEFARRYFQERLAGDHIFVQEAYLAAIRDLGRAQPALRDYLMGAGAFGWPVGLSDMPVAAPQSKSPVRPLSPLQAYPNPGHPGTTLVFELSGPSPVNLLILDARGRRMRTLLDGEGMVGGRHRIHWDGRNDNGAALASGVYFFRLEAGGLRAIHKVVLIR